MRVSDAALDVIARYMDPRTEQVVESPIASPGDVATVVSAALALVSGRGRPAIDFQRSDGSTLIYASDGDRALLVWTDSLGASFHSVGGREGGSLIFDYFGSWSEAPSEHTVTTIAAIDCLVMHVEQGGPGTGVLFEPG